MAGEEIAVQIEGYTQAMRGLRKVSKELPKALRDELRAAADIVRLAAVQNADGKQLAEPGSSGRGTGALIRGLKTFVTQSTAGVRDTATNPVDAFPYPKRIEFGGRTVDGGGVGPRAFLFPAAYAERPRVEARIDEMFDRLRSGAGLGKSGSFGGTP